MNMPRKYSKNVAQSVNFDKLLECNFFGKILPSPNLKQNKNLKGSLPNFASHIKWKRINLIQAIATGLKPVWPVWLNGWEFVYELSGCGFESSCSHLNFGFRACFEQGVPWHSGNYRMWIHSETCMWHGKNIQFNIFYSTWNRQKTYGGVEV